MVGRPKSMAAKAQIDHQAHDELMSRAVEAYLAELKKPDHRARRGLRTVCRDFEALHYNETGVRIPLSFSTLGRLADGGCTRKQANESRQWLSPIEEDVVVEFILVMDQWGWPLSHRRIKEHCDRIARAHWGTKNFPDTGVGKNWVARFIHRHSEKLKMMDSRPLEDKRGRAANPHANRHYWKVIGGAIEMYLIKPHTTFGSDEVGVQTRGEERERVATSRKKKGPAYQQCGGNRENTTVIVTICADGTSIPPAVIFKGAAYQVSWGENNPLNASIGYQKKGWTSGEIGAEWIKIFDEQTKHKVKDGEHRLLLVDGHNSHYTVDFLIYAREHLIVVLCYIPHTTHIYQGLDVVIFSPLKKYIGEERDKWLRENGAAMDKNSFLVVYGKAHIRALTPENIKAAFKKTGVWPFNPKVVTEDMLAPSKETSCEAHLPVPPADPAVNVLATMFRQLAVINDEEKEAENEPEVISEGPTEGPSNLTRQDVINEAVVGLSQTKLAHLISTTLTTSNDAMPTTTTQSISLRKPSPLLSIQPTTETEILLLAALREAEATNQSLTNRNIELQAGNLLNEGYCGNVKGALQFQENKKKRKGQGTLRRDLAVVVTGDDFTDERVLHAKDRQVDAQDKETRKEARAAFQAAKMEWQRGDDARKALKASETEKHRQAVAAWEAQKGKVVGQTGRGRGRTVKPPKPKMGPVPKQLPMPRLKDFLPSGGDSSSSSSEGGSGEESDEDEEE